MNTESRIKGKIVLIFAAALLVGICLVVPVWQSAVNAALVSSIGAVRSDISAFEGIKMALEADIAHHTTPEYLISEAVRQNINFTQISNSSTVALAF